MTSESHNPHRSLTWRLLAPAVFILAGVLLAASAISSGGTDLRAGRFGDLDSLVNNQARDLGQLRAQAADLTGEVNRLSEGLGDDDAVRQAQKQVDALGAPAGLEAVRGPGVSITLDDAPEAARDSADDVDVNRFVVHQEDIQAVVNALWAGGAEAMTIQGQRVVSTTGIKCVGNTVVLHEVPYAPPYVISAIGSTDAILAAVNTSPYIGFYLRDVRLLGLGWAVDVAPELTMPGYTGSTELSYARPAGNTGGTADKDT